MAERAGAALDGAPRRDHPDNVYSVGRLATHRSQERFVAPVKESFIDALVPETVDGHPVVPWMRAIEADGEPVGFLMLARGPTRTPRRSSGGSSSTPATRVAGSDGVPSVWWPSSSRPRATPCSRRAGSRARRPGRLLRRLGFVPTGDLDDGEVEAAVPIATLVAGDRVEA